MSKFRVSIVHHCILPYFFKGIQVNLRNFLRIKRVLLIEIIVLFVNIFPRCLFYESVDLICDLFDIV